jgi:D-alanyl-D-alanine carboxypeptidase/D-alanyl-D-alanine-endopeptidase (penicillin-binding protein 4)
VSDQDHPAWPTADGDDLPSERPGKTDQAEHTDQAGKADQPAQSDQVNRENRSDPAEQAEQSDQAGQTGQADRAGDAEGADSRDRSVQSGPADRADRNDWVGQADQAGQADRAGQSDQGGRADRRERVDQAGQADRVSQAGPSDQTGRSDRGGRAERAGLSARSAQDGRASDAGQSTQRIQFPMVDPDTLRPPAQQTTPIQRPGFPPPEPPRAAPMRIEPGVRPPMRPKASSFRAEQTVQVAPIRIEPPRPEQPRSEQPRSEQPRSEQRRPEPPRIEAPAPPPPPPPRPPAAPQSFLADFDDSDDSDDSPQSAEKPRRRRTGLIVAGAIVLVIAVGAGVVFAVPGVKEALGFGETEPEVVIKPPPAPVAFTPNLRSPSAEAPTPSAQGVQAALSGPASVPALGTLTGTVLDAATGTVLWDKGAATPLVPASTIKILTGGAALLKIDHGTQYSTRAVAGPEPGSVILVGGGDPTLNSLPVGKRSWYPGAAHLDELVAQVKANSGGKVTQVFVDRTRYTGADLAPGWLPGDVGAGYMSPTTALMMDGGRADPTKDVTPRSANPPRTVAAEFAKRIGATMAAKPEVTAPTDAKVLGEVKSAPLTELVDNAMIASDNVLADTIAREVAKAAGEEASFDGVSRATLKVLQENGFDVTGAQLTDGSGLSTNDKVPARLLAEVLAVAAGDGKDPRTAKLRPLLGGLPVAGGSGTLEGRFAPATPAASGRGWVRAKTGTLLGVNSLAGVVLDADGRMLAFALMSNGSDSAGARPALDAVAATLRGCGCT